MTNFEKLIKATEETYNREILQNPVFETVLSGKMTREQYIAYLRETFHLVKHTSKALAMVGARLAHHRRELRGWFFHQSVDEHNHDLFCIDDLRALGEDPDKILAGRMGQGTWGLVAHIYFLAAFDNPAAILGVASATEGLGADVGAKYEVIIREKYGYPMDTTTFLRSHGISDQKHVADAIRAINNFVESDEELDDLIHARDMTLKYYGEMLRSTLETKHAHDVDANVKLQQTG